MCFCVVTPLFIVLSCNSVNRSLQGLDDFIAEANAGLTQECKEGDITTLLSVMGFLKKVRERMASTDEMFEPLKQTIKLLQTYNMQVSETVHQKLRVSLVLFSVNYFFLKITLYSTFSSFPSFPFFSLKFFCILLARSISLCKSFLKN